MNFRHQDRPDPSMLMGSSPMGGPPTGGSWPRQAHGGTPIFPPEAPPPRNPLHISWQDPRYPATFINAQSVLEYFSNHYNPFYDRTCNNETLKMQRLPSDQLSKFAGIEYTVLYALEPLFVIRKQKRHNPTQVTPIADYYIISGTVFQAPDLCSVVNSRLLTAINGVRSAFEEAQSYVRYHPTKGYSWEFKGQSSKIPETKEKIEIRATAFQRTRVDALLADLAQKFPPPVAEDGETKLPQQTLSNVGPSSVDEESTSNQPEAPVKKRENHFSGSEPNPKRFKTEPL